jgi:hypothetical protein
MTSEEIREAIDEARIEPVVFLAACGDLTEREISDIEAKAIERGARIGTGAEHWGSGGVEYPDRRAVKMWKRVRGALGG